MLKFCVQSLSTTVSQLRRPWTQEEIAHLRQNLHQIPSGRQMTDWLSISTQLNRTVSACKVKAHSNIRDPKRRRVQWTPSDLIHLKMRTAEASKMSIPIDWRALSLELGRTESACRATHYQKFSLSKKKITKRKWTQEELDYLNSFGDNPDFEVISKRLQRSTNGCRMQFLRKFKVPQKPLTEKRKWTSDEIQSLRDMFRSGTYNLARISNLLKRSKGSCSYAINKYVVY